VFCVSKGLRFHDMSIRTIDSIKPLNYKFVYDRSDEMPNLLESVVICIRSHPYIAYYIQWLSFLGQLLITNFAGDVV
jgi:hypothetical protein